MANFVYNEAKRAIAEGEIDLGAGGDDIRVMLVMTNTTADTEKDINTFAGFTDDDEFDGSGYSSPGLALANEIVNEDAPNDRAEFDADNLTFSAISAGTRQIQAAILYKFITNKAASLPLAYIDQGGFPFTPGGGDIVFTWNVQGILQVT